MIGGGGGQPQELDQPLEASATKIADCRLKNWTRNVINNSQKLEDEDKDKDKDNYTNLAIRNNQQIRINNYDNNRQYNTYNYNNETPTRNAQEMESVLQFKQKNQQSSNIDQQYRQENLDDYVNNYEIHLDNNDDNNEDGCGGQELLSEALLAVGSAEEYAAKITKLQQACLLPLKEDLADWLNKIMNMSTITKENFMDKLDNGVIICRMAKIISIWCYQQLQQQLSEETTIPQQQIIHNNLFNTQLTGKIHSKQQPSNNRQLDAIKTTTKSHELDSELLISTTNVHAPCTLVSSTKFNEPDHVDSYGPIYNYNYNNHHHHPSYNVNTNKNSISSVIATPLRQPQPRTSIITNGDRGFPLRSSLQSINSFLNNSTTSTVSSTSTTNLNGFGGNGNITYHPNQFINNLIRIEQTKIWEDAKCRTFYARDNVSNFIRWSKEFGVNQSVLFESDDLVLHANTRQVVLCLLDVARIACVKHGFTEAPGLVKFEQEIDRELSAEQQDDNVQNSNQNCNDQLMTKFRNGGNNNNIQKSVTIGDNNATKINDDNNSETVKRKLSSLSKNARRGSSSIGNATDDLIMRYCIHKEEEAAKKKAAEAAAAAAALLEDELKLKQQIQEENGGKLQEQEVKDELDSRATTADTTIVASHHNNASEPSCDLDDGDNAIIDQKQQLTLVDDADLNSIITSTTTTTTGKDSLVLKSPSGDSTSVQSRHNLTYDNRVDSLDSGEGRTESASTSHSRTPVNHKHNDGIGEDNADNPSTNNNNKSNNQRRTSPSTSSSIPRPIKRSNSSLSMISNPTSSIGTTSELSSSRSSLLSAQDSNSTSNNKRSHISSDLDGKVMRIAKSYYGKGVTKGVTRLSEGKYKIADRIVFVRLLKGHRVMVRIGGGWDTLENFLFRHKSDPSQVIDVDNLLPVETKMSFEKSSHHNQLGTPNYNKYSKLPYYRRSSSASSTNLSISNLSVSNQLSSSSTATTTPTSLGGNNLNVNELPDSSTQINQTFSINTSNKSTNRQIPYLLINRGQNYFNPTIPTKRILQNNSSFINDQTISSSATIQQHTQVSQIKGMSTILSDKFNERSPILNSSSRTSTAAATSLSTTNLYPATLTTRLGPTIGNTNSSHNKATALGLTNKLINKSNTNLNKSLNNKKEAFKKLGRSNDSLEASYYKSPSRQQQQQQQHFNRQQKNGSSNKNNNLSSSSIQAKRKSIETHTRSTNSLVRQANSVNG